MNRTEIEDELRDLSDRITRQVAEVERFKATMSRTKGVMRPLLTDDEDEDLDLAAETGRAALVNPLNKMFAERDALMGELDDILAATEGWDGD